MRRCIFCGRQDQLTGEHVWPEWIKEVLPHLNTPVSRRRSTLSRTTGEFYDTRIVNEIPIDKTTRWVCHHCNTRWMSDLERKAQPALEPLMLGQPTTLSDDDQRIVAFWAAKMAAVLEYTQPAKLRGIPQAHRDYVYNRKAAPPTLFVSLAAYTGEPQGPVYACSTFVVEAMDRPPLPDDAPPNAYSTAFGIGQLVFEVFGHVVVADVVFSEGPNTVRIWPHPRTRVRWPPSVTFRDEMELIRFLADTTTARNVPTD